MAPLQLLYEAVVELLGKLATPGAFYQGGRLMAIDGFVVDAADTEKNNRAFERPGSGRFATHSTVLSDQAAERSTAC